MGKTSLYHSLRFNFFFHIGYKIVSVGYFFSLLISTLPLLNSVVLFYICLLDLSLLTIRYYCYPQL